MHLDVYLINRIIKWYNNLLRLFRNKYPLGENIVVSPVIERPYSRQYDDFIIQFHSVFSFMNYLDSIAV